MERADLRVAEIFKSLQGESTAAGRVCTFIRLAGCNLNCSYCDTRSARAGGRPMTIKQILDRVKKYKTRLVEITGGEPLLQPAAVRLLEKLKQHKYEVLVETNGTLDIRPAARYARIIMDIKCPGAKAGAPTLWSNLKRLRPSDEVKFVINGRADYQWSRKIIRKYQLAGRCCLLFSPAGGRLPARKLARWMLQDNSPARLNLQLHKIAGLR